MTDDTLDAIVKGLNNDGIYLSPDVAPSVSREQLATLRTAVKDAREPVYVVMVDALEGDAFGGSVNEMLSQVHDQSGQPGTYVSAIGFGSRTVGVVITESWDVTPMPAKVTDAAEVDHPDDAIAQVVATVDFYAHGIPQRLEGREARDSTTSTANDPSRSEQDGIPWGPVGLGAALIAGVVALVVLRKRRAAPGGRSTRALTLPASIVERASSQSLARHRTAAEQDLLALGSLIDDSEVLPRHDSTAWQAAIDRYEAGTRLLDEGAGAHDDGSGRNLLDVIGAIVLAQQGRDALEDAIAGHAYAPRRHCYLHPLHQRRVEDARIESGGRQVSVPLCGRCRDDLHRGRVPDALDVMVDGQPRHYFDSGISPWAETAYGAQGDDLVAALHRRSG